MEILLHELDKENFFYDLITTMAYSQFGPNELFSRGFTMGKHKDFPSYFELQKELNRFDFPDEVKEQILNIKTFTPLIFVPGFETKSGEKVYRMDPNSSAAHFNSDTRGVIDVNIRITHMTVLSAFDKIIKLIEKPSPVKEFFRHIRNAAGHNGKFHFTKAVLNKTSGELKETAKWRSFQIKASMQGIRLFPLNKKDNEAFWGQGDFVDFLLDFENHHPEIKSEINTSND